MASRHDLTSHDAVRLLTNAIRTVHHLAVEQEGLSPPCNDEGELILQKALYNLAFGDLPATRELLDQYESWLETGRAAWPFSGS
ncbi:MAG: hypothetical protein E5X57_21995 [Mesorhizobium sp.]|uniref:hypothetical protein n=1 Tax=Mesorhizobium sp. TaxID=1871066 RepID=UPI00121C44A0|nr:hypothetical protein [Mesorhizobium sp.]TIQ08757.1 MAG: hypothetical protein E5X57_21995 [Mesorhizobium sp.]TJV92309.1 MAG: hypothetical protein E5X52_33645 [Mesorhizobium sp.]